MAENLARGYRRGKGFDNADVAYSAIGLMDVEVANEQIKSMYDEEESAVYFTCANVAASRIRDKVNLYDTFSRDELDGLLFYCMEAYRKLKERRPYDGSIPFEAYITKFVLATGRQTYARSKQTDNEHLVATAINKKGEKEYYGATGKMPSLTSTQEIDPSVWDKESLLSNSDAFEDLIINKVDAESVYVDQSLIKKLEKAHPLLKIVFKYWALDCVEGFVPFYKYVTDERVLTMAAHDEKCAKYVLEDKEGNNYINPSTASKILYKFQELFSQDDVAEIVRFGTDFNQNPYLSVLLYDIAV